ncbi:MAG: putative metalloprotease CJM1_0395 family protein [Fibrobacterota bacterium]|nr:putative metalloprotease CJM1_0395 family protein [Chitinispirillaceae bacterium]
MPEINAISGASLSQSYWINGERAVRSGESGESPIKSSVKTKDDLTEEERKMVLELKNRDREVRAHEAAHMAAGGQYTNGGAKYSYQKGPDGQRYAVGGEVSIDTSAVKNDPQATIMKMQVVKRAASAPASPSGQDRAVAAAAAATEMNARKELRENNNADRSDNSNGMRISGGYTSKGESRKHTPLDTSSINLNA